MTADDKPRIVAQFSCGAASAVATKLSIATLQAAAALRGIIQ